MNSKQRRRNTLLWGVWLPFVLLLTVACGKSESPKSFDWIPEEDLSKPILMISVHVKSGKAVSARVKLGEAEDQQQEVTWEQTAPEQLIRKEKTPAPWQGQLSAPFSVQRVIPYIQAVSKWMEEQKPEQTEFQISFLADYTEDVQENALERLRSAREQNQMILAYSLDTAEIVLWETEDVPEALLGHGIIHGITNEGQIAYPIWIVE